MLFSVHPQRETAGEMLEEVHKGLRPNNALKVAIDCRLLGVAILCHTKLLKWIIRCLRNDIRNIHTYIHTYIQTAAHVDHDNNYIFIQYALN